LRIIGAMRRWMIVPLFFALSALRSAGGLEGKVWERHVIDDSSRGADGVRLADVNGDGLPDVATGWEEGGVTRVYLHPGHEEVREPWPATTVGKTPSVEDAVWADLDGDGAADVVSCCEGKTKSVFVHWAPGEGGEWTTERIPATAGITAWMFCLPMQVDGKRGIDLVVAAKGGGAMVGWLESPEDPRKSEGWKLHKMTDAGWVMSLRRLDVDRDGDGDVVVSDRKGKARGVWWLENPGKAGVSDPWRKHAIGGLGREVMFLDVAEIRGVVQVAVAVKPSELLWFQRPDEPREKWPAEVIPVPADGLGRGKGVAIGDLDGDGDQDVAWSCEGANPPKSGLVWLRRERGEAAWKLRELSGPDGIKFDRIELLDLDGDGDLDAMTCDTESKKLLDAW
jgi:hypothetical protein